MILGFRLTVAVTGWAAVRDAAMAASPDLRAPRGAPPYAGHVGPAVLAAQPGTEHIGFRLSSTWTEQAAMTKVGGTQRYCYDIHGIGLLTDRDALLGSTEEALFEGYEPQDAFRLAVTRIGRGCAFVSLGFLTGTGWHTVRDLDG